jgi:cytochrome b subunit of formate dehydrogenase
MRLVAALAALVGAAVAVFAFITIAAQQSSGVQPWSNELSDNIFFARTIPFVLGAGIAFGMLGAALADRARHTRQGHVRRFSRATIFGHWLITLGFVLALPTGVWQYLGGVIDKELPIPLHLIYRVHYIGAAIILFCITYFLAYWWQTGHHGLLVPRGQWRNHLRAFTHELPPALGQRVARTLRLQTGDAGADGAGQFSYYETAFSFPTWTIALGLITITGLIKALRYLLPVPGPILWGASTLHVAAMVLLVLKVLDHMRYVFERWPLMVAMTTTWISDRYAQAHFPRWRRQPDKAEA